jgi:hypothetical protein
VAEITATPTGIEAGHEITPNAEKDAADSIVHAKALLETNPVRPDVFESDRLVQLRHAECESEDAEIERRMVAAELAGRPMIADALARTLEMGRALPPNVVIGRFREPR